jgi:Fe-S oxidoreductase
LEPLLRSAPEHRFNQPLQRILIVAKFWGGQWKQLRYPVAGALHIIIFVGFIVLIARSISLVLLGVATGPSSPPPPQAVLFIYSVTKDYASTLVLGAVIVAAFRRVVFKPARYAVPADYGNGHVREAVLILVLIGTLMMSESLFEASASAVKGAAVSDWHIPPLSLHWLWLRAVRSFSPQILQKLNAFSYLVHDITFFGFLCLLPFGKHFHVCTSLFNVYFANVAQERLKPVRWNATEEVLANLSSVGVKQFEDFTWKQMLDFYSCADCGRCSDQCPSSAVGRQLSPRLLAIKSRDYSYRTYPAFGSRRTGNKLVGTIYSEEEIWSCTTCAACEEECPLLVEYIDKIVDLRRGLVDDGRVPASLQKPLKALESRGNPYGKLEKKRGDWAKSPEFQFDCPVAIANGRSPNTLYFVDSVTSYDDRMQSIARATARILRDCGEDFAILGIAERDSGHEARRFGEELLFFALRDHNTRAIVESGATNIITSDPHAYNALKHDYNGLPPVKHIAEVLGSALKRGRIQFKPVPEPDDVYVFHDPCYLGRHNHVYEAPRDVLDAVPRLQRVEMKRCRDRSFCCGGGGLMLFHEVKEEERMGVMRVRMAADVGANVIVTACPFCLANIEDAIKVAGLEGEITAVDLAELADKQIARISGSVGA